jgi:uncharacterized protein YlxW (UPF0749 family)
MPDKQSRPGQTLPDHVTLPLLDVITRSSLDEDYGHVAERKRAEGRLPPTAKQLGKRAATVIGVFGILIVTAAVQTSRNAGTAELAREELIDQITTAKEESRQQQRTLSRLREEVDALTADLVDLRRRERSAAATALDYGGSTGFAAVTGPGLQITVDDSPDGSSDGVIRDEDLAILLDGLWAAGAEAISVNDQRITALSGIRTAGDAIHIRTLPLRPPYVVLAVGDPDTLEARFADTAPGLTFHNLAQSFNFVFEIERDDSLSLPAGRRPQLRSAHLYATPDSKEVVP